MYIVRSIIDILIYKPHRWCKRCRAHLESSVVDCGFEPRSGQSRL